MPEDPLSAQSRTSPHRLVSEEDEMFEQYSRNPQAVAAEVSYRHDRLLHRAPVLPVRARWWRRRPPRAD